MRILVVKETVYNNGTSCERLTAKFQAYREREYFTLQKRIWQPFVPTELKSLDGITMARPAISAKRFSVFCHRVMSQVSMEANGLDKEKWTHAALYDSTSWASRNGRNMCVVPAQFSENKHHLGKLCNQDTFSHSVSYTDTKTRSNK